MLKAVIDTKVLVSAVLSKAGTPAEILRLWRTRSFLIATSEAAIEEVQRVINLLGSRGKYNLPASEISNFIHLLRRQAQLVLGQIKITGLIPQDKSDEVFLTVALEAEADFIVSGDKHLLGLKTFQGIPIVTSREFLYCLPRETRK